MLRLLRVVVKLLRNDAVNAAAGSSSMFRFNPGVARVIQLFMLLICTCHWAGCIWWLISSIERRDKDYDDWGDWGPTREMVEEYKFPVQYAHALLWGVGVITGLIPFDVMPTTGVEAIVTVIFLLFGFSLNIVIVSSATSALQVGPPSPSTPPPHTHSPSTPAHPAQRTRPATCVLPLTQHTLLPRSPCSLRLPPWRAAGHRLEAAAAA